MPLVTTYTSLGDVRRILRATPPQGRVRFSESYSVLKKSVDNTGTVELMSIGIHQTYADVANYNIVFGTDSSSFTMYKIDKEKQTDMIVGIGLKQLDFSSNDGYFTIDATSWIGWAFPYDVIEFMTDSHISYIDATQFIQDAEFFVDSIVEKNIRFNSITESSLRFPLDSTSVVPKSIQLATSKIASYFIYKSLYLENINEDTKQSFAYGWLKEGLELLASYVDKWNLALSTSTPIIGVEGLSTPIDLNDNYAFKSSSFNLMIPIDQLYLKSNYDLQTKSYNFLTSKNYLDSVVSDIAMLCDTYGIR